MVSNKNKFKSGKRPYTLKTRAARRDEVHRRITLAAVYLHGSVGPAHTTVSDIARRAGVRRATVYNHFPTDVDLIDACSSHWFGEHPPPTPAAWANISDPIHRTAVALEAMYNYFDGGQEMLKNVLRDALLVPALDEILKLKWQPLLERAVETLAAGWGSSETASQQVGSGAVTGSAVRASLRVALDFFTWQTLTATGMSNSEAARLAVVWIQAGSALRV